VIARQVLYNLSQASSSVCLFVCFCYFSGRVLRGADLDCDLPTYAFQVAGITVDATIPGLLIEMGSHSLFAGLACNSCLHSLCLLS
jgi:hypothetical protein